MIKEIDLAEATNSNNSDNQTPAVLTAPAPVNSRLSQYQKKDDKRSRGLELAQYLEQLAQNPRFSDFAPRIKTTIKIVRWRASAAPAQDRELVISSLRSGATMPEEICDDTNLAPLEVAAVIEDLKRDNLLFVEIKAEHKNTRKDVRRELLFLREDLI